MAKASICVYAESGRGKTTLIDAFMEWLRSPSGGNEPDAIGRLYTVEHSTTLERKVNQHVIERWEMQSRETPFEIINWASRGYWPEDVNDEKSKIIAPNADTWKRVRAVFYEGLSTFSDYMGGSQVSGGLASRSGRKERIGPAEETISFTDGSAAIGGNSRSHYNIVQIAISQAVSNSHKLPVYLIWTAHEEKAKDDRSGLPIVGPEVFGQKATQKVPRWFANMLHLTLAYTPKTDAKTKEIELIPEYRLWLKSHFDPSIGNIEQKAKSSIEAVHQASLPSFLKGGGLAIGEFMDILKKHDQIGS